MQTVPEFLLAGVRACSTERGSPGAILRVDLGTQELCWQGTRIHLSSIVSVTPGKQQALTVKLHDGSLCLKLASEEEYRQTFVALKMLVAELKENSARHRASKSQQILDSVTEVLQKHSADVNKADLPGQLDSIIGQYTTEIWDLEQQLDSQKQGTDSQLLQNRLNTLRKKARVLEIEGNQASNTHKLMAQVQTDLRKEKQQSQYLVDKIQEVTQEKAELQQQLGALKEQVERTTAKNTVLQKELQTLGTATASTNDPHCDILVKGFHGYVCLFLTNQDLAKSVNLTPRRPFEDGLYKKRHIALSSDLQYLVWRPVSLFSKKSARINLAEVSAVFDGTEDPRRHEPFPHNKYITILARGMNLVVSVDSRFFCYLEAIKHRYQHLHNLPLDKCELPAGRIWQLAGDQLSAQSLLLNKILNRYKNTLIESICYVDQGPQLQQETYLAEIQTLRQLNEDLPRGLLAADPETYLRDERACLLERKAKLESLLASLSSHSSQ